MKKFTSILLTSILVASCSKVNKMKVERNALFLNKESSYEFSQIGKEINVSDVVNMMKANQNFVLYLGTEGCIHCQQARPNIIEYVKSSKLNLYHIDTVKEDFYEGEGWDIVPSIGKGNIPTTYQVGTPSLLFFEGLEMKSIIIGSTTLSKVKTAKNAISSRIEISNSYSINSMEELNNVINKEDSFLSYVCDSFNQNSIDVYQSIKNDFFLWMNEFFHIL